MQMRTVDCLVAVAIILPMFVAFSISTPVNTNNNARQLCNEHDVLTMFHQACQIPPRKRDLKRIDHVERKSSAQGVDRDSKLRELMQWRDKRSPFTTSEVREMRNRCCIVGCSVRDFHRYACY